MPMQSTLFRLGLSRARGVVVHSAAVERDVATLLALPTVLVPHPPNLELAPTPLPPAPPLRLLFLGFVRPYKGLDVALDALALLRDGGRDARLTVAGEFWDPPLESWRARIAAQGLAERVLLRPGYESDDAVRALLAEHHVLVAPYRSATQSGVVPLAHAAGRPAVASDVGGLAAQVGAGGAVVPPEDARALAAALAAVGDDLERHARAARAAAVSWSDVADAVLRAGGVA
jgi:glycosyltransferase involved in cell wall biosynthesis